MIALEKLPQGKTISLKIGTAAWSLPDGQPNEAFLAPLTAQIVALRKRGNRPIVVSSGAVGYGRYLLARDGVTFEGRLTPRQKGFIAGRGQVAMMNIYGAFFRAHDETCACSQLLLNNKYFTNGSTEERENIRNFIEDTFAAGMIPIVNENDPVRQDENLPLDERDPDTFSDNDGLSSLLARLVGAPLSVTVSTHCVHDRDPRQPGARPVPFINLASDRSGLAAQGISTDGVSSVGTGGMAFKLHENGLYLRDGKCGERTSYIVSSASVMEGGILAALAGEPVGTKIVCHRPDAVRGRPCGPDGCVCRIDG